jgi:hypothetical protein
MKTTRRHLFLLPLAVTLAFSGAAVAQITGDFTTITSNSNILATGTFGTSPSITTAGSGTRMMWYPRKAAFRAGGVSGTEWDDINIGNYSTALGGFSRASGNYSTALGTGCTASGTYSTAIGGYATASGTSSIAMGFSTASNQYSVAIGQSTASGSSSTAMGQSIASGNYSTSMGQGTKAGSLNSTATGRYNTGLGSSTTWVLTDPLFEIGNGTSAAATANALTVLKNGNLVVQGTITSQGLPVLTSSSGALSLTGTVTAGGFNTAGAITSNSNIIATGTHGTSPSITTAGAGTRMMWNPRKSAFRAGAVSGTQWNDANIGDYSTAFGYNCTASGTYSTASGSSCIASDFGSTAFGYNSIASGQASTAFGDNCIASGNQSTAMGSYSRATALHSTAMGYSSANGFWSTAMGNSTANGYYSTSMGGGTRADSYYSTATGRYNTGLGNTTTWVPTDSLLEIGNGDSATARANALTVLKNGQTTLTNKEWKANNAVAPSAANSNAEALVVEGHSVLKGNTTLNGKVTLTQAQGDISMGIYQ